METEDKNELKDRLGQSVRKLNLVVLLFALGALIFFAAGPMQLWKVESEQAAKTVQEDEDNIQYIYPYEADEESGLVLDRHVELVKGSCTSCHSAAIIFNTRASREGWQALIRWMQETQGLWDLHENEEPILDYLTKHYGAPAAVPGNNQVITEWYNLD